MASTYRANALAVALTASKSMLGIRNTGAQTVKITRIWVYPNTVTVTGVIVRFGLRMLSNLTAGTSVTPIKHDTSSPNIANLTCVTGGTPTATSTITSFICSSEEIVVSGVTPQQLQTLVPYSLFWDIGYGETNIEPVTLLQNDGFDLFVEGSNGTIAGSFDIKFEFTIE